MIPPGVPMNSPDAPLRAARGWLLALALAAGLAGGCAGSDQARRPRGGPSPSAQSPITNTDPCAMRLHELSGALLLYYFHHYEMPQSLAQLQPIEADKPLPPLACPVSGVPYIYDPDGIYLPERGSWVVLYDPAPSHARHRWAVTVQEPPEGGETLVTKVIALPESFFALRPPQ